MIAMVIAMASVLAVTAHAIDDVIQLSVTVAAIDARRCNADD